MENKDIKEIMEKHRLYLEGKGGKKGNFSNAN